MGILNKLCILIMSLFVSINGLAKEARIYDGEYLFKHRFAEQPNMENINLIAILSEITFLSIPIIFYKALNRKNKK